VRAKGFFATLCALAKFIPRFSKRTFFLSIALAAAMAGWWYIPSGSSEAEFAENSAWDLCDYRFRRERLTALKFYNRFGPLFWLFRKQAEASAVK
jgi:hypothetical protein